MDDVGRVAASEVRHGDADLLVVVVEVDANVLLQLVLASPQRIVHGVLVDNPAVEEAVFRSLLLGEEGGKEGTELRYLQTFALVANCLFLWQETMRVLTLRADRWR